MGRVLVLDHETHATAVQLREVVRSMMVISQAVSRSGTHLWQLRDEHKDEGSEVDGEHPWIVL